MHTLFKWHSCESYSTDKVLFLIYFSNNLRQVDHFPDHVKFPADSSGDSKATLLSMYVSMTVLSPTQLVVSYVSSKTTTCALICYFARLFAKKNFKTLQPVMYYNCGIVVAKWQTKLKLNFIIQCVCHHRPEKKWLWYLLPFPQPLFNSVTFPGFPGEWSPCFQVNLGYHQFSSATEPLGQTNVSFFKLAEALPVIQRRWTNSIKSTEGSSKHWPKPTKKSPTSLILSSYNTELLGGRGWLSRA